MYQSFRFVCINSYSQNKIVHFVVTQWRRYVCHTHTPSHSHIHVFIEESRIRHSDTDSFIAVILSIFLYLARINTHRSCACGQHNDNIILLRCWAHHTKTKFIYGQIQITCGVVELLKWLFISLLSKKRYNCRFFMLDLLRPECGQL